MKISIKQYAQSLYEVVSQTENVDIAIKNFIKVLIKKNQLGKAEKIIDEFVKIWNLEQGVLEGDIVSARELKDETTELLNGKIVKLLGAKEVNLKNRIDKNIFGGFIARLGDTVIDGSVKSQLQSLRNKLVN